MRYTVYGAGAVGGTIGARLHMAGSAVVLIARGEHLRALQTSGLRLRTPTEDVTLAIPAVGDPEEIGLTEDDAVILAMKSQHTVAALERLAAVAPPGIKVVCAQNAVANEPAALRRFEHVYGMCVMLPATHLVPGEIIANGAPLSGLLDLGRYPSGADATAQEIACDLTAAGFSSNAIPDIMRWKNRKLVMNLGNALEAACGMQARRSDLLVRARDEALACFAAAGMAVVSEAEDLERRGDLIRIRPVAGERRGGGSSWQSLARGAGSIETDYLNGEVVLMGRIHGVPTPVNAALQSLAQRMAAGGSPPGSWSLEQAESYVAAARSAREVRSFSGHPITPLIIDGHRNRDRPASRPA